MITTNPKKPDIVQAFDFYKDREYYKIQKGFLFQSELLLRTDTLKAWKQWNISCEQLPDKIFINEKEYNLTAKAET